jgi:hypothetical protein
MFYKKSSWNSGLVEFSLFHYTFQYFLARILLVWENKSEIHLLGKHSDAVVL